MILEASPATKKAVKEAMERMKAGKSDKPKTRADTDAMMAKRRAERNAQALESAKKDAPNLSALEKQHAEMKDKYQKLGGSNYQYADREQNLSEGERQARAMEGGMNQLGNRIGAIKKGGYAKGGKINLKDCSVSTVSKGKRNSDW
jgi:uncharacterized protein involved in exopolysaccharide biosynthesis